MTVLRSLSVLIVSLILLPSDFFDLLSPLRSHPFLSLKSLSRSLYFLLYKTC